MIGLGWSAEGLLSSWKVDENVTVVVKLPRLRLVCLH
jgi:hypothetical protein